MAESEDRTQAPSERRLQRAREEGQAPLSRELVALSVLAVAALMLTMAAPSITRGLVVQLQAMLAAPDISAGEAVHRAVQAWVGGSFAFMGACIVAGAAGVLLQTKFLFHGAALAPDLARLNPKRGLKRIFGGDNLVEVLKGFAKLSVLAWAFWRSMVAVWPTLGDTMLWTTTTFVDRLTRELVHLLLLVLGAQAGIALLDAGWTHWRFHKRLQMSREDLKDEAREADGDPKIKARLRQLRMIRARRRMMAAVSKATVVITNPTHYAVALSYERGAQVAPRIIAKGVDDVAARIREAAQKAGVPLVANPPLARALYLVPLDAEVPAEHFRTVAEIIAYVWRLKGQITNR